MAAKIVFGRPKTGFVHIKNDSKMNLQMTKKNKNPCFLQKTNYFYIRKMQISYPLALYLIA
jgi:hypothetical protein